MSEITPKNQVDIFNFLRVFALICVLGIHSKIAISSVLPAMSKDSDWMWVVYTPAWIAMGMFFILSGYLLGKGFYNGKYKTDKESILKFYIGRIIRIVPMYLFFILIAFIFINPNAFLIYKWKIVVPLLTFTYDGTNGLAGIGALWFISTIFQLYLIAPIIYKFLIEKYKNFSLLLIIIFMALGLAYRMISESIGIDWYKYVYTASWANIDYFAVGMLINSLTQNSFDNKFKKLLRPISIALLTAFTIYLMHNYYVGKLFFYRYIAPTAIIIIFIAVIYAYDYCNKAKCAKPTLKNVLHNPLRIFDLLSPISFGMYLYHSNFFTIASTLLLDKNIFPNDVNIAHSLIFIYVFTFIILFVWCTILHFAIEKPLKIYYEKRIINEN